MKVTILLRKLTSLQPRKRTVGQAPFEKPFFLLNGGLNTEASPLNAPDNTTIDESNLEILRDGSRRRRKAIDYENGGAVYVYPAEAENDVTVFSRANTFQWENVGGDPSLTFQVVKVGGRIHFYVDSSTLSAGKKDFVVELMDFATTNEINDVIGNPVTFTSHQGVLFASAKYVHPMYIEYVAADDNVVVTPITIRARDFAGINDEVAINSKPTTLSNSHAYNLINRGWRAGTAGTDGYARFFADTGYYPAKNMIPWKGYSKKAEGTTNISTSQYNPADWSKSYSSDKLEAEVFGEADAPQGHILVNPFDTTYGQVGSGVGAQDATVTTLGYVFTGGQGYCVVTMTVPLPHSLAVNDPVEVTGGYVTWYDGPGDVGGTFPITGVWPAYSGTSGTTIVVRVPVAKFVYDNLYDNISLAYWTGPTTAGVDPVINDISGVSTNLRPTAIEMGFGRIWYAGFGKGLFSDTVLFSQIIMNSTTDYEKYGKCFQVGDPTDEFRAMVVPTDGGAIQIPGLSGVKDMVATQASLLIFADSGVYEITGGNAPFSANNFSVRTITDAGAWSAAGIVSTEFGLVYTSPRGVMSIAPDSQSGRLSAVPITDDNIKTLWNDIPDIYQRYSQFVYDYALQNLYLLYTDASRVGAASSHFDSVLVYTLRNKGWYRLRFPVPQIPGVDIKCALVTKAGDGANNNKKVKFVATTWDIAGVLGVSILDLDHDHYLDYSGTEQVPYLITAYDGIGGADVPRDFAHRRQAPVVHVYSKRTETGVDVNGDPVNPSSIILEPRWDFTDTATTGRVGSPQQAHRVNQLYLGDPTENGQPVVISRLKLRGRGRSLHLKFSGEAGKDFHLLGYAILYKIGRNV